MGQGQLLWDFGTVRYRFINTNDYCYSIHKYLARMPCSGKYSKFSTVDASRPLCDPEALSYVFARIPRFHVTVQRQ